MLPVLLMQQFCVIHSLAATPWLQLCILLFYALVHLDTKCKFIYTEDTINSTEEIINNTQEIENHLKKEITNLKRSPYNKLYPVHSHHSALMLFPISRQLLQEQAGDASIQLIFLLQGIRMKAVMGGKTHSHYCYHISRIVFWESFFFFMT